MLIFRGVGGETSKDFLILPRFPGEIIQFDEHIFQIKWVETTN